MQIEYRNRFDHNILMQFKRALEIALKNPTTLPFFIKALCSQYRASLIRKKHLQQGTEVPPLMIISITKRCNLNCTGCYSKVLHKEQTTELSAERYKQIFSEAVSLGVSIILLAGGEPLIRRDILEVAACFPSIIFPIFTNGISIDSQYADFFAKNRNLIPVISLEGREKETDFRRGEGVFAHFESICTLLQERKLFWGVSHTLTNPAFKLQLSAKYLKEYIKKGCQLFFFVEYVPIDPNSMELVLTNAQKESVQSIVDSLMLALPGLFITFPGDEDQYGGCLAAGRGFLHLNPSGQVEACPFAPFSDTDMNQSGLKEALDSKLLAKIRANHNLLKEGEGGCALWANKDLLDLSNL